MKRKLDALHLTLLAVLGLDVGCAVKPAGIEGGTEDGTEDEEGDSGEPFVCDNPQPILQPDSGLPSGFVECDGGFIHRADKVDPSDPRGPDSENCAGEELSGCESAADCVDGEYGRCVDNSWGECTCTYGCSTDADCGPDQICAPAGVAGSRSTCIAAHCTADDECGEGLCGLNSYDHCCGTNYMTACADADEPCHIDSDCTPAPCSADDPSGENHEWQCSYTSVHTADDDQWTCEPPGWCECDCGRPFFVDGEARVAPTLARRDWSHAPARELAIADAATRARLAEYWTRIGQFEHASIASFARFGLQLMRLGAPPNLVRDSARALADEIEHARLAFGLAGAYAGAPVGPGALDVGAALEPDMDRFAIVDGLIAEACVGETLAAIEAHEAASWAEDPVVAAVLERIAADEWRHAQLGWRALGWMLAQGDHDLRSFALARFEVAMRLVEAQGVGDGDRELRRHGVLDDALRAEVRRSGIAKVIRPCVAALNRETMFTRSPLP